MELDTPKMSHEEMIDTLKGLVFGTFDRTTVKEREALDMAIALLEQKPCDDCVSRKYLLDNCVVDKVTMPYVPVSKIEDAPPVAPQPKMGTWIFHKPFDNEHKNCNECIECSQCNTWLGHDCYAKTPYCPMCGAKMEREEK